MQSENAIRPGESTFARTRISDWLECDPFSQNELLCGIAAGTYAQFASKIEVVSYEADEIIFQEDDPGSCLYLIAQGSVKISKRSRAAQQETLAHMMERDFFGEMALVDTGRRSAQATAVGPTVLGRIDTETWDLLLRLAPHEVMSNFTRSVTKRLRHNNQNFIEQMMRTERLSLLGTTISSIVHDMNNPIGSILGACEAIQTMIRDPITEKMTRIIRDSVDRMQVMTRELMDFSRGNTQLNLQPLSVAEILEDLTPDFSACRPKIAVKVDATFEGTFQVDRHRLLRVLGNLIRNARDAMKRSERKELGFAISRADSNIRFEITDTGCGIPHDLLPRIFEPFVTHGKANGTGLGLAISKSVVEAHKGSITVSSSDQGTSFQIELPLALPS